MSLTYTVEIRNMFVIQNISVEQIALLTTLNVSKQIDIKVNLLDVCYFNKENGLYDCYLTIGVTNNIEITILMEEQFKKNILALNLPYQIKKVVVVGGFSLVITNVPGIYRRFITQAFEANIPLEINYGSFGTKTDPIEQTFLLLCKNPFDVDRLSNLILNTNYAEFDKISEINNEDVLCIVKSQYKK